MFADIEFAFQPIVYIFIFFIIAVILIVLKIKVLDKKEETWSDDSMYTFPNGIQVGNGQLIGEKDYQNDYFAVMQDPRSNAFLAVATDGIGNKKIGKFASVIIVEILKNNFYNGLHKKMKIKQFFIKSFNSATTRLNDNIYGNRVGATLIAVVVEQGVLHFASVGNCSLLLYRNGEMININDINSIEIQIGKISLGPKDIAMLCTKGVRESLTEMEIIWQLSEQRHPYEKCQALMERIRQKRWRHQDNATIIILEKMI